MYSFKPYYQLDGLPNIIVDGSPHKDSKLVLSHWIDSGTPMKWMRDTSAEIVLDYIVENTLPADISIVSNDHFDQDGLIGIFGIMNPELALENKELLIDVAVAGDFGKFSNRTSARISMALNAITKPESKYFSPQTFNKPYPEMAAIFYQETLKLIPDMIADISAFNVFWKEEDEFLTYSEDLINKGIVKIEEDLENDLAIIFISEEISLNKFHRFAVYKMGPLHDMAIHNHTQRARILYVHGKNISFKYRYETWVQLKNNIHPLRVDLEEVAKKLSEVDSSVWTFTGSDKLVPELKILGNKGRDLNYKNILENLIEAFKNKPVNWNPYR